MEMNIIGRHKMLAVRLSGDIDHHSTQDIRENIDRELMRRGVRNLMMDFSGTGFMDSSGIGLVMGRYKKVKALGGKAWIICNNPNATRILEMSGVFQFIEKCQSIHDAV